VLRHETAEESAGRQATESVLLQAAVNAMVADRMPRNIKERMKASVSCGDDSNVFQSVYATPSRHRTSHFGHAQRVA